MDANDHRISLTEAQELVQRGRNATPITVTCWRIGADIIREILAQPEAASLRVYPAATNDGVATLVFLAADATGRDMTEGVIAEHAFPCPPFCDPPSQLS